MVGGRLIASLKLTELKEELTKRMPETPAQWPRKAELVQMLEEFIRESDLEEDPDATMAPTIVGRLLQYRFSINQPPFSEWFGGKVRRDRGAHWVDVLFDDGESKCVLIQPSAEGD